MILHLHGKRLMVRDIRDASVVLQNYRDSTGLGSSALGEGYVHDNDGNCIARVSYNGRVWPPGPYRPHQEPLLEAATLTANTPPTV